MNYFEFYGGDYQRDTADLSLVEHGAYLQLLCSYYSAAPQNPDESRPVPSGLPAEDSKLFRIAKAMTDEEREAVLMVANRFFPICPIDGRRHNARSDQEIAKAVDRIRNARANGSKGGRPPKPRGNPAGNPEQNPNGTQSGTQTGTQMKALQTPHAIEEQKQKRPPAVADTFDFRADLFNRWKAASGSGGGSFLSKLFNHGGCSTGPRTTEGRARALANLRQFTQQDQGIRG